MSPLSRRRLRPKPLLRTHNIALTMLVKAMEVLTTTVILATSKVTMATPLAMVEQVMVTLERRETREMGSTIQAVHGEIVRTLLELAGLVHINSTRHLRFHTRPGKASTARSLPAAKSLEESMTIVQ